LESIPKLVAHPLGEVNLMPKKGKKNKKQNKENID